MGSLKQISGDTGVFEDISELLRRADPKRFDVRNKGGEFSRYGVGGVDGSEYSDCVDE